LGYNQLWAVVNKVMNCQLGIQPVMGCCKQGYELSAWDTTRYGLL